MSSPSEQPIKRIVSRGEYVQLRGKQVCLGVSGVFLMLIMVATACAAIILAISLLPLAIASYFGSATFAVVFLLLLLAIALGFSAYFAGKWGDDNLIRSEAINDGIPLTRANAADLSASDSLVRAAEEPAQQTILLRAAAPNTQAQEEQLLRPSAGQLVREPEAVTENPPLQVQYRREYK